MTTTASKENCSHTHPQTKQNKLKKPRRHPSLVWHGGGRRVSFSAARLAFMLLSHLLNVYCSIVLELQSSAISWIKTKLYLYTWENIRCLPWEFSGAPDLVSNAQWWASGSSSSARLNLSLFPSFPGLFLLLGPLISINFTTFLSVSPMTTHLPRAFPSIKSVTKHTLPAPDS